MAERRKQKPSGTGGATRTAELKPERVQARSERAERVGLICHVIGAGDPGEDGMLRLDLDEPFQASGFLVRQKYELEPTMVVIESLHLRVPVPERGSTGGG